MKPTKNSVAAVITNQADEFLIVKRPEDEPGTLAGVWGFPAITLLEGESEEEAVARIGAVKLGVRLNVGDKIGEKTADRGDYVLHLSDYAAHLNDEDIPSVPQSDTSMTQYVDWRYTSDTDALQPAAHKGSLCSQIYLESRGKS
jgi:hypothetical protein